ncbi:PGN_0703 family putative restriction endonuclease [Silvibacterium acidisoli]|uniref:PGN_0703 family putative restriction endonuclease n=1 Tax=Acidobacteriaceae bacterium ZG23-2 TaxID=2883246 RepID=UPI00406C2ED0
MVSLRREISIRNQLRAESHEHDQTYGEVPSVVYHAAEGRHGNFLPQSYRAICAHPEWARRLLKAYTGSRRIPRASDRRRFELDCATSSDALLMNIFCYPRVLHRPRLCELLGIERGLRPEFGFKPRTCLTNGRTDCTEVDMRLGDLLVEAKLTESGFQAAPYRLIERYPLLEELFDISELRTTEDVICEYQLVRSILAAYSSGCGFTLLCDGRRQDMFERWMRVVQAIRSYSFRSRLRVITWQEVCATLPKTVQSFLQEKYGILNHHSRGVPETY